MTHKILIIDAPFYNHIITGLKAGAEEILQQQNLSYDIISVAGALEIPPAIVLSEKINKYSGYIALGCVIKGETAHFDIVASESARGLMELSLKGIIIGQGILTVYTEQQAIARATNTSKNKGAEAAKACLSLLKVKDLLQKNYDH